MQMMRSYAEEKNIELVGQKPIVFDQVYVDKDMISQVIVNLLSNAIRYTPRGGHVTVRIAGEEGSTVLQVEDDGPGIPEAEREAVLDGCFHFDEPTAVREGIRRDVQHAHYERGTGEPELVLTSAPEHDDSSAQVENRVSRRAPVCCCMGSGRVLKFAAS